MNVFTLVQASVPPSMDNGNARKNMFENIGCLTSKVRILLANSNLLSHKLGPNFKAAIIMNIILEI